MRASLVVMLLAGYAAQAPSAAQGANPAGATAQAWHGTLRCDAMPTLTTLRLVQPFELRVAGGQASYQRYVRTPDTDRETEVPERGGGAVAADGAVTLRGRAEGRGYVYDSAYSGVLPPGGGGAVLTGVQHWRGPKFLPIDRACSITVQR